MSSIIIESSPVSISGNCYANAGQSITFTIVSGITSASTIFEWFLNGESVYFGTSYTIYSAAPNDEVYVKVIECSNTIKLKIGNWIEDNIFYYNDIISGSTQTYNIDMNATFSYKILSIVLQCSNNMSDVELRINNIPVVWRYGVTGLTTTTSIDVTSGIIDTDAYSSNTVFPGDDVTLVTSSIGNSILLQGKMRFLRYTPLSPAPLTTTTTSTTTLVPPTTTTTTVFVPPTTTTTTLSCGEFCFLGFYAENDPVHPNGGTVAYVDCLGHTQSETFIFVDAGIISITAHSIISHVGCSPQTCPTTTTTTTVAPPTTTTTLPPVTTTTTTPAPSISTVFIHIPN